MRWSPVSAQRIVNERLASYGLIALIGLVMLARAVRRSRLRRAGLAVDPTCCGHVHGSAQADHRRHGTGEGREQVQQGALSLGVGLVPCTGAVLILLYAIANDILLAGVLLVSAIAAGMAATMGGLGILSVVARRLVAARVAAGSGGEARFAAAIDYTGALAITAIGGGLFWVAL